MVGLELGGHLGTVRGRVDESDEGCVWVLNYRLSMSGTNQASANDGYGHFRNRRRHFDIMESKA